MGDGGQVTPNLLGPCGLCASRWGKKHKKRKGEAGWLLEREWLHYEIF